jgi:hypothetical protein
MTKTDLPYITAGDLRPAGDLSPVIDDFKSYAATSGLVFLITFSKKLSPGPKNSLARKTRHAILYNLR